MVVAIYGKVAIYTVVICEYLLYMYISIEEFILIKYCTMHIVLLKYNKVMS